MGDDAIKTAYETSSTLMEVQPRYSEFKRVIRIFFGRPLPIIGLAIIVILIIVAILAPLLAPYDPIKMDLSNMLKPPSIEHLLGTDTLGRDILSRIIYGTRISLIVGLGAIGVSTAIGLILGLTAAYLGGKTFVIIMRLMDTLMSIPMLILALIVAAMLGGGIGNIIIALGISMIPLPCRLVCSVALSIKQSDYVLAGKAMGMSNLRLMFLQILPNSFPPIIVLVTTGLGAVILSEAALSFLGIGITPPTPAWGGMINEGYAYLLSSPFLSISPGIAIALVVFGFNMVGDGLRDALDPRLRGAF